MTDATQVELRALGAASSGSFTETAADLGALRRAARITLTITACSGQLVVHVETSSDSSTGFRKVRQFEPRGVPDTLEIVTDALERYARITGTVGTSATFGVVAEAHQLYAPSASLAARLPEALQHRLDTQRPNLRAEALLQATADVAEALAVHRALPLTVVPETARTRTLQLAAYYIRDAIGWEGGGFDEQVREGHEYAQDWLKRVRRREFNPFGGEPAPSPATKVGSYRSSTACVTSARRSQWGDDGCGS